jgi:uncharacterized phage protein (TIGR01671 family)
MNRAIKFRCFLPTIKKMSYPLTIEDLINDRQTVDDPDSYTGVKWMQYTGLKDKNGKEIYEGDTVIAIENAIDENFNKTGEVWSKAKAEVFWDNDMAGWALRSDEYERGAAPMSHLDTFHVIGNIFEHPELLKPTT